MLFILDVGSSRWRAIPTATSATGSRWGHTAALVGRHMVLGEWHASLPYGNFHPPCTLQIRTHPHALLAL